MRAALIFTAFLLALVAGLTATLWNPISREVDHLDKVWSSTVGR